MKHSQNFPQQTHFIGVLASEDITATLEDCRRYMNEAYGCRSGHSTPIHVTLIPPFRLPQEYSTEDLALAIEKEVLPKGLGFTAKVNNFDAFGDRTIFAKVEHDPRWTALRDAVFSSVIKAAPGCTKKGQRPSQDQVNRLILAFVLCVFLFVRLKVQPKSGCDRADKG